MISKHRLAEVASLLAEPSRAAMLGVLIDGRALPAGALAREAGVSAATASAHLRKLRTSGLIREQVVGRHRFYRLANPEVAGALEALARLIPPRLDRTRPASPDQQALQAARLCYDHLAGALGVAVTNSLIKERALTLQTSGLVLGPRARVVCASFDIDVDMLATESRPVIRTCIDWTERREHVSGALGAAIASEFLEREWVRRQSGTRALRVTPRGQQHLGRLLGDLPDHN